MDKVLLVIGDAAEATDTLYPYFRVQEAGYACVVAAPEVRAYHLVIHDKHPDWDITVESRGYELASDIAFRDVVTADYAALIVSGGRAPEYLRYDRDLMRITQEMTHLGRPVSSTCHGIEILAAAGVLRGRRATTVAKCRYDIESFGGTYVDEPVVVDGNIITSRTFWDAAPWMRAFMEQLAAQGERAAAG